MDTSGSASTGSYRPPDSTLAREGKKWYLQSQNTRYGETTKKTGGGGCKYQIIDRSKPLAKIEIRYKDSASLKLLGWDGEAKAFAFLPPWQRSKLNSAGNDAKRRKVETVDLTGTDDDDDDIDGEKADSADVKLAEGPAKPKIDPIVVE